MGTLVNDTATSWQAWPKAAVSEFMITKSARPDALQDVIGADDAGRVHPRRADSA